MRGSFPTPRLLPLAFAGVLAAGSPTPLPPGGALLHPTTMIDNAFVPRARTVPVGVPIRFINNGAEPHTATALDGSFDSGQVNAGETRTIEIRRPGIYRYVCRFHPEMTGTMTAVRSSRASTSPRPISPAADPGSDLEGFASGLVLIAFALAAALVARPARRGAER